MILQQPILVNGVNYSWCNLTNVAFGVPVVGITAVNFSRKQDKKLNYGIGNEPTSVGYGNVEYDFSISVYREWLQSVINAAPSKDILLIQGFDWKMAFGNIPNVPTLIVTIKNVEFTEDSIKTAQGDTKIIQDLPMFCAGIQY